MVRDESRWSPVGRLRPLLRGFTMLGLLGSLGACAAGATGQRGVNAPTGAEDPRADLRGGWTDAETAASGMRLVVSRPRPAGFVDERDLGNILFANSDMAFRGDVMFVGSFHGFQIWDISNPAEPRLRTAVVCPGGQGDLSIHGDLLFMSVEMPNGRVDCGTQGNPVGAAPTRFLGVRIFDVGDLDAPRQVGAVQTCRGSHTHTLVPDSTDPAHVYIYVSGTSAVRAEAELTECSGAGPVEDPENTSYFRIEVIRVPVASPQQALVISRPRIFADAAGNPAGLWRGGAARRGAQETATTDQCHDITVFPELRRAAGACSGNGILLDVSNPADPRRIDAAFDPNFAYWHSATFNNTGRKIVFTDEWGGGSQARCRREDPRTWGANAIFRVDEGRLQPRGYYKLPVVQTAVENCVAHNGSIVPVPGRDLMVQAWYQGGISLFDFTEGENTFEVAYFDRGPLDPAKLLLGGFWSAYWYNGRIWASEMSRGLDVLELTPGPLLTASEIEAARLVRLEVFNPQTQPRMTWPAHPAVARAYLDQLARNVRLPQDRIAGIRSALDEALRASGQARRTALDAVAGTVQALSTEVGGNATPADRERLEALMRTLRDLPSS